MHEVAGKVSLQSRGAAPLMSGWVDLKPSVRGSNNRPDQRDGKRIVIEADWLSVTIDSNLGSAAATPNSLVLVLGRPVLDGRPVSAPELAPLFDGSSGVSDRLGGRFALVYCDLRSRAIELTTDRFGVWPLCWGQESTRLAFSDRADSVPTISASDLDPQALYNFVYFHMIPAPRTAFSRIKRLEPATCMRFDGAKVEMRSRWFPEFARRRGDSLQALSQRFRRAIVDSVAFESSGQAVGCFLSGGTDSSTVAGTLQQITGAARTFSIGFDQQGYDEMVYARIAARHFGTEHTEHYVDPSQLVEALPTVAAHYDQPFGNSSALPSFICARVARERGITKLLAGDGGDELFGGNSRYAKQKVFNGWNALPTALRHRLSPPLSNQVTRAIPGLRKVASYVDQATVSMPARLESYNLLQRFGAANVFTETFLAEVDTAEPSSLQSEVYSRQDNAPFIDQMLAYDWRFTLSDNDLPKVCRTTALAGIAAGFPLLSDALVDLSLQLAPSDKVRGLQLRHFFKHSLRDFLPEAILRKKKHGFGLPVGLWLVKDARFQSLARTCVTELVDRGFIRKELVADLFSRRLEEHAAYYGEMIWILMTAALWLRANRPDWKLG